MVLEYVYKPKRRVNGEQRVSAAFRGRYRDESTGKVKSIGLGTTDKRVAEKLLRDLVVRGQLESEGLVPPARLIAGARRPLLEHLEDFVADLEARGKSRDYVRRLAQRVRILVRDCGWSHVGKVDADGFERWRHACQSRPDVSGNRKSESSGRLTAKTLNDYLAAMNGLLGRLRDRGHIERNPLEKVRRVDERVKSFERRAFTQDEIGRLLAVSGGRRVVYLVALLTGLRRNELRLLRWGDVHLDCEVPFVSLRTAVTKNGRADTVPLHVDVVCALRDLGGDRGSVGHVFAGLLPRRETVTRDLVAAGIAKYDADGRKVDFHALRHTFCTMLAVAGISERERQELMRHRDPRQTNQTYTDAGQLSLASAVRRLPGFGRDDAHIDAHKLVTARRGVARVDTAGGGSDARKSLSGKGFRQAVASSDTTCHNGLKTGGGGNRSSIPE